MGLTEIIVVAIVVLLILIPPKYDPAIRFKESDYDFKKFLRSWRK